MALNADFKNAKKDYEYMCKTYGDPSDLTGGMVWEEHMFKVCKNPTIKNALKFFTDLINYGFQSMEYTWRTDDRWAEDLDIDISEDKRAVGIYDKYC